MAKITYTNKVALNENPEIADINKVKDTDMNEIKTVVNGLDDNIGTLSNLTTTNKTSAVAAINELNTNKASTNEVLIQDTEPTASDNKIWIDTGEIASPVSEITNSYSTSTGIGYSANYVNNMNTYSEDEVRCGTWYDGKPLYRKTIYISSLPNNTTTLYQIFTSTTNIGVCFIDDSASFMYTSTGDEADTMNWIYSTSGYVMTCIKQKQIRIKTSDDKSSFYAYVTVKYTKTTD